MINTPKPNPYPEGTEEWRAEYRRRAELREKRTKALEDFQRKSTKQYNRIMLGLVALIVAGTYWNSGYDTGRLVQPIVPFSHPWITSFIIYFFTVFVFEIKRSRVMKANEGYTKGFVRYILSFIFLFVALTWPQWSQDAHLARNISARVEAVETKYGITPPAGKEALSWLRSSELAEANRAKIKILAQASTEDGDVLPFLLASKMGIQSEQIDFVVKNRMVRQNDLDSLAGTINQVARKHHSQETNE